MADPGLLPAWESLKNGDVGAKRKMTAAMLEGFWESTFAPDPVSGRPFAVDAIISNPPAFGHVHIAEALGVPLMMSFSTSFLSQPRSHVSSYVSYALDAFDIIQTPACEHQGDKCRKEYDQLLVIRYGKSVTMARSWRHHQCFPKCNAWS